MIEWSAITLTLQLAGVSTLVLLVLGTPLAWWLARADGKLKTTIETLTALPLVLPPTVLGFYLLIFLSPNTPLGEFWFTLTGEHLTFSFSALVIASVVYSLPFMVQPLQGAFESLGRAPLEAAASLGASPLDTFIHVVLPLSKRGYLTAVVLTFAHTIGEFGVVLMVGGNIPGRTRVISIEIFTAVETLDYRTAHLLSGGLLLTSFTVLVAVYVLNRSPVRV